MYLAQKPPIKIFLMVPQMKYENPATGSALSVFSAQLCSQPTSHALLCDANTDLIWGRNFHYSLHCAQTQSLTGLISSRYLCLASHSCTKDKGGIWLVLRTTLGILSPSYWTTESQDLLPRSSARWECCKSSDLKRSQFPPQTFLTIVKAIILQVRRQISSSFFSRTTARGGLAAM